MDRERESPNIEVRSINLDLDREEIVEFDASESRRLPGAVKWFAAAVILVAALIFYVNIRATPTPNVAPPQPAPPTVYLAPLVPTDQPVVTNVGYPLFGATGKWELFGRTTDSVVRFEPSLGRITVTSVPQLNSSGPSTLLATSNTAMVVPMDNVVGYVVPDGRPALVLPRAVHPYGEPIAGPDPDHFWIPNAKGTRLDLVDIFGTKTGPTLTLPANADINGVFPDGSGYVLVMTPHGAYDLRSSGRTLVSTGQVVASGPTGWLVAECDKKQQCSMFQVNRKTGRRHLVGPYTFLSPPTPGVISSDGHSAAVLAEIDEGAANVMLIDLSTGATHVLDLSIDADAIDAMVFSPDGKWLFVADSGVVPVDVASANAILFNPWGDIDQLAIRPD